MRGGTLQRVCHQRRRPVQFDSQSFFAKLVVLIKLVKACCVGNKQGQSSLGVNRWFNFWPFTTIKKFQLLNRFSRRGQMLCHRWQSCCLPTPQDQGSNPAIGNFLLTNGQIPTSSCLCSIFSHYNFNNTKLKKAFSVCLGFEPAATEWQAQTIPRSYGGRPTIGNFYKEHLLRYCQLLRVTKMRL